MRSRLRIAVASSTFSITIGVADVIPNIAYTGSPFTYVKGTAISTLTPSNSGGTIVSCASAPSLPAGLSLSTGCVITGAPTAVTAVNTYVVTATNSGGSASTSISVTVNDVAPAFELRFAVHVHDRRGRFADPDK